MADHDNIWIFGYGSLMWDPGVPILRSQTARLRGYHPTFSILSGGSWGTTESPGLALGLHHGGSCVGRALEIASHHRDEALEILDRRESAYLRISVQLELSLEESPVSSQLTLTGTKPRSRGGYNVGIAAQTYLADPNHQRYAGHLSAAERDRLITTGAGHKGRSLEYLHRTVAELEKMNVRGSMHRLLSEINTAGISDDRSGGRPDLLESGKVK